MIELCNTREMVEKIKDIISKHNKDGIAQDQDVADILKLSHGALTSRMSRNSSILEEVFLFCERTGLEFRDIVLKKDC